MNRDDWINLGLLTLALALLGYAGSEWRGVATMVGLGLLAWLIIKAMRRNDV